MGDKVDFDHGKANAVISAMRGAVTTMQGYKRAEDPLRSAALKDWKGDYGDRFRTSTERGEPWISGEHRRLITALTNTAQAIEDAGKDADKLNGKKS